MDRIPPFPLGPNPPRRDGLPLPFSSRRGSPPPPGRSRPEPAPPDRRGARLLVLRLSRAFLAGAALVFLVRLPGLLAPPPPPAAPLQAACSRKAPPPLERFPWGRSLPEMERWLWEARAWPSLWKEEALLERARRLRNLARAGNQPAHAARMELLLEIYGRR